MEECRYCQGYGYIKPNLFDEHLVPCPKCNPDAKVLSDEEIEDELFQEDLGMKISTC